MNLLDLFSFIVAHIDLIILVLLPWVIVAGVGWLIINQVGKSEIQSTNGPEAELITRIGIETIGDDWLKGHGFAWDNAYRSAIPNVKIMIASWKQRGSHTYVSILQTEASNLSPKIVIDITSTFGKGYSLTTAGTDDGPMFPICPGLYKQHFRTREIERLWQLHLEAETVVAPKDLSQIDPLETEDPIEMATAEVRRQINHVKSLWLWPLRVPWWFFVNRPRHLNKTVLQRMGRRERERLGVG